MNSLVDVARGVDVELLVAVARPVLAAFLRLLFLLFLFLLAVTLQLLVPLAQLLGLALKPGVVPAVGYEVDKAGGGNGEEQRHGTGHAQRSNGCTGTSSHGEVGRVVAHGFRLHPSGVRLVSLDAVLHGLRLAVDGGLCNLADRGYLVVGMVGVDAGVDEGGELGHLADLRQALGQLVATVEGLVQLFGFPYVLCPQAIVLALGFGG